MPQSILTGTTTPTDDDATLGGTQMQRLVAELERYAVPRFGTPAQRDAAYAAAATAGYPTVDGMLCRVSETVHERVSGAWVALVNGTRGNITGANLAGYCGYNANALVGQCPPAAVRSGEELEHRVSATFYGGGNYQTAVLEVIRYGPNGTNPVSVGSRQFHVGIGDAGDLFGNEEAHVSLLLSESPPAGPYFWQVMARTNKPGAAYLAYGEARHSVSVVRRVV